MAGISDRSRAADAAGISDRSCSADSAGIADPAGACEVSGRGDLRDLAGQPLLAGIFISSEALKLLLRSPQDGICAAPLHQFSVRAAFRYFALVHHEDAVRVSGVHKAVRDQDYGLSPLHLPDAAEDDLFALHVDVAGRLVENIDRAVMQQRPGKGQSLSLAAGKVLRVLCQLRIQSVRAP